MNKAVLLLALISAVFLTGCGTMTAKEALRYTQGAVNVKNMYEGSSVKEEVVWKIRSIYGQ